MEHGTAIPVAGSQPWRCPDCDGKRPHLECRSRSCAKCCRKSGTENPCPVPSHQSKATGPFLPPTPTPSFPGPPSALSRPRSPPLSTIHDEPMLGSHLYNDSLDPLPDFVAFNTFCDPPNDTDYDHSLFSTYPHTTPSSSQLTAPTPWQLPPAASQQLPPATFPAPSQPLIATPVEQPRRRLAAASAQPERAPALRITMQMNSDWQLARGGPDVVGIDPVATPTLQIRAAPRRRAFIEPRFHQRFRLTYWVKPGDEYTIVSIDRCENWPQLEIRQIEPHARDLFELAEPLNKIEIFLPEVGEWMGVPLDYIVRVATDQMYFLRPTGMEGWDREVLLAVVDRLTPRPQLHMRYNMPHERSDVRHRYHELRSDSHLAWDDQDADNDSGSDVVSPVKRVASPRKRTQTMAALPLPAPTRPRLQIVTDVDPACALPSPPLTSASPAAESLLLLASAAPSPSAPTLVFSAPTILPTPAGSPAPLVSALSICEAELSWPSKMHVVDVVAGLMRMKEDELKTMCVPDRFELVFQHRYVQQTLSATRKRWDTASGVLKQRYLDAGRTDAGLWGRFSLELAASKRRARS